MHFYKPIVLQRETHTSSEHGIKFISHPNIFSMYTITNKNELNMSEQHFHLENNK